MGQNRESVKALEDFNGRLVLHIGGSNYVIHIAREKIGDIEKGDPEIGRNDLLLEGDEQTFRDVFEGRVSPGLAFNFGLIRTPGGKARENLICAVFRAMRANQLPPGRDLLSEIGSGGKASAIICQSCGYKTEDRHDMVVHMMGHTSINN
jgi:putative sterol carrier protein